jgi:hypothetical protein
MRTLRAWQENTNDKLNAASLHQKQVQERGGYSSGPRQRNYEVQGIAGHGVTPPAKSRIGESGTEAGRLLLVVSLLLIGPLQH